MQANERTFGIEIECHLPPTASLRRGQSHLGNGSAIPGFPGWGAKRDGSLHMAGYVSVEIVSPVLRGEEGLFEVVRMVDYLASLGAVVNDTCGLHIHCGASDYDSSKVNNLVTLFKRYEKLFFSLNGEKAGSRWSNGYCKNSSRWASNGRFDRYQSLNLTNLNHSRKTVEFRLFAGTINVEVIVQAIVMCVGLVNKAEQIERVKTPRTLPQTWQEMMDKFNRVILTGNLIADIADDEALEITQEQATRATIAL